MAGITKYVGWAAGDSDYVCDGTDDHIQINQALAWAAANPDNIIYLRSGNYDIALSLLIGSCTVLRGDATAKLKLNNSCMWNSGIPVIGQLGSGGTYSPGTLTTAVEIYGFEIDANEINLTHAGVDDANGMERIHGQGFYNIIYLLGTAANPVSDIHIHDMTIHDGMGDGVRIKFGSNVRVHDNDMWNLQHSSVYLIEVDGADVYENDIQTITTSAVRYDNCRNSKVRDNDISDWTGTTSAPKGGAHGVHIGNQPTSYNLPNITQNIEIYNNTVAVGACGVHIEDYDKSAVSSSQVIHIYNNTFTGCGRVNWATYFSGIDIYSWGNGITIEYNTISGSYRAGILVVGAITTGVTASVKNNNITGTIKAGTDGGYGIWNKVSSSMSVVAENNYLLNNVSGNYQNVTPVSESTIPVTETLPGDSTTDDDIPVIIPDPDPGTGTGIELPEVRIYQKSLDKDYYITGRTAYINGKPFNWANKKIDVGNSLGQDKCPGAVGWALTDFDLQGAELTLDCGARSLREMHEAIAAFTQPGRVTIELGGDFSNWQATGTKGDYSTDIRLNSIIPRSYHPYSLLLVMDQPYFESVIERIRSRYIYNSMLFSADDCYRGNIVKNSSFEDWTPDTSLEWESLTSVADNSWYTVRYAKELAQFCAVGLNASPDTGIDNIMIGDGTEWHTPTGLSNATNHDGGFRGLCWCPEWMMWVALGATVTSPAGYCCIVSDATGETWTAKPTPTIAGGAPVNAHDNAWGYCLWIPPNETVTTGRVIAFSYGADETYRVMYSDDECETWTMKQSANDGCNWLSAAYSPELERIVSVAYSGTTQQLAQYSDDFGETWTISATPSVDKQWTSITWADALGMFVACSQTNDELNASKQVMTSPTGLTGTWTLQETPIMSTTKNTVEGDISHETYTSPEGRVYSSPATAYTDDTSLQLTIVLPALSSGQIYRFDDVFAEIRTKSAGKIASIKITATSTSMGTTTLAEFSNNLATYVTMGKGIAVESGTGETVTINCYLKTSNANYRAYADWINILYTISGETGGTVTYHHNQWRSITWSAGQKLLVCVGMTGVAGNGVMYSTDAVNWLAGTGVTATGVTDNEWMSVCYATDIAKFMAVGKTGTGNRSMISDNYGTVQDIAPNNWDFVKPGQSRSDLIAYDGLYSLQITGDGTSNRGNVTQKIKFASGIRYVLSAYGNATGITAGSLRVDILAGASIVKELIWDADTDWTQQQISFKFDVSPTDAYVRVRGYELNSGAVVNCDKILIERASDFELSSTGTDIATYGTVDTVPDVIIEGVTSAPDTATAGTVHSETTPSDHNYSSAATTYSTSSTSLELTVILPALSSGVYRLDQIKCKLKTAEAGIKAYLKVTVQGTGLFNNVETILAEWINTNASFDINGTKVRNMEILSTTTGAVTLRYYMKTSDTNHRAIATELGYVVTELTSGSTTSTTGLYMWNNADTTAVMACCNVLPAKYTQEINADGTGSLSYAEDFLDDNYLETAYASAYVTYNAANTTIVIGSSGYIIFPFDCKYPVTGVPYIHLYVISGAPQILIADDSGSNGAPGTFYAIDNNVTTDTTNSEITRLLDNEDNMQLNSKTKYYVKITPYSTGTCEFGSLLEHADLSTVDAERFKIYAGGQANTIGVQVTGNSSCVATLRYHDLDPAA